MDLQTSVSLTDAFQHGFSAGFAFAMICGGIYMLVTGRMRRDP